MAKTFGCGKAKRRRAGGVQRRWCGMPSSDAVEQHNRASLRLDVSRAIGRVVLRTIYQLTTLEWPSEARIALYCCRRMLGSVSWADSIAGWAPLLGRAAR